MIKCQLCDVREANAFYNNGRFVPIQENIERPHKSWAICLPCLRDTITAHHSADIKQSNDKRKKWLSPK